MVPGGGGIGAGTRHWLKGESEGEGGAGPQRPLPAATRQRGLLFCSPLGRDPRSASDSGSRPPPPPLPGLEPPPIREAGDELERLPHPGTASSTIPPLPAGHLDPGPRTDWVPETLPAQLGGPAPRRPLCRVPSPFPDQTSAYPWTPPSHSLPPPLPQPGAG